VGYSVVNCVELALRGLSCPYGRRLFGSGNGHCQCAGGGSRRATGELARNFRYLVLQLEGTSS
jgi:hypothetical protein